MQSGIFNRDISFSIITAHIVTKIRGSTATAIGYKCEGQGKHIKHIYYAYNLLLTPAYQVKKQDWSLRAEYLDCYAGVEIETFIEQPEMLRYP